MQLLEVEDVVDETPVVTAWLAFSIFLVQLLANALIFASYQQKTRTTVFQNTIQRCMVSPKIDNKKFIVYER